jgi:hypothetical protein
MGYLLMIIYPIGFLLALTFFKFFGKKLRGIDYDSIPDEDRWPDDYDSNAEAYVAFSAGWPVMLVLGIVIGTVKIVFIFSKWYLKL